MHLRSCRVAHVLALGLIAVLTPACTSNKKLTPPNIQATIPVMTSGPVPVDRSPLLVFQFDRPMDISTLTTANIMITEVVSGNPVAITSLEYNDALNELRIIPGALLTAGLSYNVFATGNVTSASGTQMGSAEGITVTVANPATMFSSIVWTSSGLTATPNATDNTRIDVSWTNDATEFVNPTPTQVTVTHYDVYVSTVSGGQDWFSNAAPMFFTLGGTPIPITGLTPNTKYYLKVVPRDDFGNILQGPLEVSATTIP